MASGKFSAEIIEAAGKHTATVSVIGFVCRSDRFFRFPSFQFIFLHGLGDTGYNNDRIVGTSFSSSQLFPLQIGLGDEFEAFRAEELQSYLSTRVCFVI